MSEQEDKELDQTISFLESPESEYLDLRERKGYRTRLDILGGTLSMLHKEGPMTRTHTMYRMYTNFSFFEPHFQFLVGKGYVQEVRFRTSSKKHYGLTEKGLEAMTAYERVKELFEE